MAIRRNRLHGLVATFCGFLTLAELYGCPGTSLPNPFVTQRAAPSPVPSPQGVIYQPDGTNVLIKGTVMGPGSQGNGTVIVADAPNSGNYRTLQVATSVADPASTASGTANPASTASGTTTATGSGAFYQPVQNADVTIKGYDWRVIPEISDVFTDNTGTFYVQNVPSQVAFFIDVNFTIKGAPYRMLGLTRTDDPSGIVNLKVDLASTLVARLLLRMWQQSDYNVVFKNLSTLDYTPLLLVLEQALKTGVPQGIADPSDIYGNIVQPNGKWTVSQDSQDHALIALDRIAASNCDVNNEITRLYNAVNPLYTNNAAEHVIVRPSPLPGTPGLSPICGQ